MNARLGQLLLVVAGSVAAGVHAGLAPEHLDEWAPLGASFVAAAAVSGGSVAAVALWPRAAWPVRTLALVLVGLVVAYVLTRLVALPPLDPEREEVDSIGLLTVFVETAGVVGVLALRQGGTR
jgi:hypothetical protein